MVSVDLKALIGRLNDPCRQALEAAAGLCLSRTNYNLEVEHWLLKLLDVNGTDFAVVLRQFDVDAAQLQRDLTRAIDRFKTGNTRAPVLSPDTVDLARDAWLIASVQFGSPATRSGHILCSLLLDDTRARLARDLSPQLAKISTERLLKELSSLTSATEEALRAAEARPSAPGAAAPGAPAGRTSPALDQYTVDLTAQAHTGRMDPVLGRDTEVRQIVDILMRRRQNNPILTGEAGVGKTAVVEGFAQRIAAGDVPPPLRGLVLRSLDMGLLQAGASVRGEFENRLRSVVDEVKASPQGVILFIDEAHTLVGAGGGSGAGDAANLLKPALARGELRTIAATTWAEYKKYFEKDPALSRRFQVVKVDEPTEASAENMMRGLVGKLESHHKVRVLDDAVLASVRLSSRYISGRHLPDKCVSVLDTACARVAIAQADVPPAVEDLRRRLDALGRQIGALQREHAVGPDRESEIRALQDSRAAVQAELERLEARWKQEATLVGRCNELRGRLESRSVATEDSKAGGKHPNAVPLSPQELEALRREFDAATRELRTLQGDRPLLSPCVDRHAVADVVSGWTGIPIGRMMSDEINTVLQLEQRLGEQVVGQSHALEIIAKSIRTSRADLTDPSKPIGVFLLAGPSGVGKTETALALAELLYGGEQNLTVINMSEFKEEHKVSLLMGSPPGYVGYGEGGVLTEALRRKPYCVLLLDEMEKAHFGVQDVFYQVFDKGSLRDGEGRDVNFKNAIIMMTSNAASDLIMKLNADPETRPTAEGLAQAVYPELLKTFKPAFLGRCTVVPYFPLGDDVFRRIVRLKLDKIVRRVRENHKAELTYAPESVEAIAARCTEVESGARNIDHIVSRTLLPELSKEFLSRLTGGEPISRVHVGVGADGAFTYTLGA
jgi:type VI secretion system protein VasG